MSEDTFGPGLDTGDFLNSLARGLGMENQPGFQQMQKQFNMRAAKDRAMASTVLRVFETPDGKKVLDWLVANTLRKGEVAREMIFSATPEQIMANAFVRAGENSVVELILTAMAQAKEKPVKRRKAT